MTATKSQQLRLRALEVFKSDILSALDETNGVPELSFSSPDDRDWPALCELVRCGLLEQDGITFRPTSLAVAVWHGDEKIEQVLGLEKRPASESLFGLSALFVQNMQVGDHNSQHVTMQVFFQKLQDEIEASEASPEEKKGALQKLRTFLSDPIVQTVLNVGGSFGPTMMG